MTAHPGGARLVTWWVEALTRTAPQQAAIERCDEIRSDVHEQIVAAAASGQRRGRLSRSLASRAVRGMPADLVWRAGLEWQPTRLAWHLHNPSTVITTGFVCMLPVGLLANATQERFSPPFPVHSLAWALTVLLSWGLLGFAAAAAWWRLGAGRQARAGVLLPPMSRLTRLRRATTASMGICVAVSATSGAAITFPGALTLSAWAWGAFGISLGAYLLLVATALVTRIWRGLADGKIPS